MKLKKLISSLLIGMIACAGFAVSNYTFIVTESNTYRFMNSSNYTTLRGVGRDFWTYPGTGLQWSATGTNFDVNTNWLYNFKIKNSLYTDYLMQEDGGGGTNVIYFPNAAGPAAPTKLKRQYIETTIIITGAGVTPSGLTGTFLRGATTPALPDPYSGYHMWSNTASGAILYHDGAASNPWKISIGGGASVIYSAATISSDPTTVSPYSLNSGGASGIATVQCGSVVGTVYDDVWVHTSDVAGICGYAVFADTAGTSSYANLLYNRLGGGAPPIYLYNQTLYRGYGSAGTNNVYVFGSDHSLTSDWSMMANWTTNIGTVQPLAMNGTNIILNKDNDTLILNGNNLSVNPSRVATRFPLSSSANHSISITNVFTSDVTIDVGFDGTPASVAQVQASIDAYRGNLSGYTFLIRMNGGYGSTINTPDPNYFCINDPTHVLIINGFINGTVWLYPNRTTGSISNVVINCPVVLGGGTNGDVNWNEARYIIGHHGTVGSGSYTSLVFMTTDTSPQINFAGDIGQRYANVWSRSPYSSFAFCGFVPYPHDANENNSFGIFTDGALCELVNCAFGLPTAPASTPYFYRATGVIGIRGTTTIRNPSWFGGAYPLVDCTNLTHSRNSIILYGEIDNIPTTYPYFYTNTLGGLTIGPNGTAAGF